MKTYGLRHLFFALVVGLAGGAALGLHAHRWYLERWHRGDMTPRIVRKLGRELALNEEQKQKVGVILMATHQKLEAVHVETRARIDAAFDKSAGEIEKLLTPEQVRKYRELRAKWKARRASWGSPTPPHGA